MGRSSQPPRHEKSGKGKRSSQSRHGSGHAPKAAAASGKSGGGTGGARTAATDHRGTSVAPFGEIRNTAPASLLSDPRAASAPSLLRAHPSSGLRFLAAPAPAWSSAYTCASQSQQSHGTRLPRSIDGAPSEAIDVSQLSESQNSYTAARFGSLPLGQTSFSSHASNSYRSVFGAPSAPYSCGAAPSQAIRAAASRPSQERHGILGIGFTPPTTAMNNASNAFLPPHQPAVGQGLLPSLLLQPAETVAPEHESLAPRSQSSEQPSMAPLYAASTMPSQSQVSLQSSKELAAALDTKAQKLQEEMTEQMKQQLKAGQEALRTLVESKLSLLEGKAAVHGQMLDVKAGEIRDLGMETIGRIKGAGEQIMKTARDACDNVKSCFEDSKANFMNSVLSKIEGRMARVVKKFVLEHHPGAAALSESLTESHVQTLLDSKSQPHKIKIPEPKTAPKHKAKHRTSPLRPLEIVEKTHYSLHTGLESRSPIKQGYEAFPPSSMSCITPQDPHKMNCQGIFSQATSSSTTFTKNKGYFLGNQSSQECSNRIKAALKKRRSVNDQPDGVMKKSCTYRRRRFGRGAFQPSDESELGIF